MSAHLRRARLLAVAAMTAVAIAACGGAATTTGPGVPAGTSAGNPTQVPVGGGTTQQPVGGGTTIDACSFLTDDDIKAVTGYTVARKTPGAQAGIFLSGCEWELVAPDEIVPPSIALGIMTEGGAEYYAKYMEPYNGEQGATPIAGLGDKAVDAGFGVVQAVKGDVFFNLQYLGEDDHEVELAKKLVAHL
jgi:hypothetical protein